MKDEQTVSEPFCSFFHHVSDFILLIDKLNKSIEKGEDYAITYKISVELDELISMYYKSK